MADGDKQVQFKYGDLESEVFNVTSFSSKSETDTSSESTFSGTLTSSTVTGYTIDIERIQLETKEQYDKLDEIIGYAKGEGIQITTMEIKRPTGAEPFRIIKNFFGCVADSPEVQINPGNEFTTEKMSFKSSEMQKDTEYVR